MPSLAGGKRPADGSSSAPSVGRTPSSKKLSSSYSSGAQSAPPPGPSASAQNEGSSATAAASSCSAPAPPSEPQPYVQIPYHGEHRRAVSAVSFAPSCGSHSPFGWGDCGDGRGSAGEWGGAGARRAGSAAICASASADGTVKLWDVTHSMIERATSGIGGAGRRGRGAQSSAASAASSSSSPSPSPSPSIKDASAGPGTGPMSGGEFTPEGGAESTTLTGTAESGGLPCLLPRPLRRTRRRRAAAR